MQIKTKSDLTLAYKLNVLNMEGHSQIVVAKLLEELLAKSFQESR